eukprot:688609-Prymnesium_polylepis.1
MCRRGCAQRVPGARLRSHPLVLERSRRPHLLAVADRCPLAAAAHMRRQPHLRLFPPATVARHHRRAPPPKRAPRPAPRAARDRCGFAPFRGDRDAAQRELFGALPPDAPQRLARL